MKKQISVTRGAANAGFYPFSNSKAPLGFRACTVILLSAICGIAHAALVFDATLDYSETQNPNGVWQYGHANATFTTFELLPWKAGTWTGPYAPGGGWRLIQDQDSGGLWMNNGSTIVVGVAPGQISLHPHYDGTPTVLRWTAPQDAAGLVAVNGQFFAGDSGTPLVDVRLNGSEIWSAANAGQFDLSLADIHQGDTIDFAVSNAWFSSNTPLAAVITFPTVPEPSPLIASLLLTVPFGVRMIRMRR
jgi:hypothetical protein